MKYRIGRFEFCIGNQGYKDKFFDIITAWFSKSGKNKSGNTFFFIGIAILNFEISVMFRFGKDKK